MMGMVSALGDLGRTGPGYSKVYYAIHRINRYPEDGMVCFVGGTYPLDRTDLPSRK